MKTLSLYEDNAGGLHLLRHSDNAVFTGLEYIYSNGLSQTGQLLSADETEYWLSADANPDTADEINGGWGYKNSDGVEFRIEPDGENAECLNSSVPNGIYIIADFTDGKWDVQPNFGTNAQIAMGFTDEQAEDMRYGRNSS